MVAKTVTMTLNSVAVLQPQPRLEVRSSKRSDDRGQMCGAETGARRLEEATGTQTELKGHQPQV